MKVKIISDSTCDLSPQLIDKYDIAIVPLYVLMGDVTAKDGVDASPEDIYKYVDETGKLPSTSAPNYADFLDEFTKWREQGYEVVHFNISSDFSSSYHNACAAAAEVGGVEVVDTRNLSTGSGLVVLHGAEMAMKGASAKEIAAECSEMTDRVEASFVVDTLTYLHRGGRCGGLAALAGSVLKLHPRIHVKDGVMGAGKKYRGRYSDIIVNYAKDMEQELLKAKPDRVFVTHSTCDKQVCEKVCDYLRSLGHFKEVLETEAGGVVSSHCGPGTLGVLYIRGE